MSDLDTKASSQSTPSLSVFAGIASASLCMAVGLTACDGPPLSLRTDEQPISLNIGGDHYVIPANYLVALTLDKNRQGGGDGALVVASWPDMGGRPQDGTAYKHYAQSNLRVSVGPADTYERQLKALSRTHLDRMTKPSIGGMEGFTAPRRVGEAYGFEHWARQHTPREQFFPTDLTHTDIFVRYNADKRIEALMFCGGEPAPAGMHPQCDLKVAYREFPGTGFKIGFDRREALADVNEIENAVLAKFLEFKAAGSKTQALPNALASSH